MAHADHVDNQLVVEHFVQDPVRAGPHAIRVCLARELCAPGWAGIFREQIDRRADPLLVLPLE
jgi:hypothetical protein